MPNTRHLFHVAALAAVCVLAFVCYRTVLILSAGQSQQNNETDPSTIQRPAAANTETRQLQYSRISDWHLFGMIPREVKKPPTRKVVVSAPETRLKLELLGVFSDPETGQGWAIIAEEGGRHRAYKVDDQLPGNAVLHSIGTDRITLTRNGRKESLSIKKKALEDQQDQTYDYGSSTAPAPRRRSPFRNSGLAPPKPLK